MFADTAALAVSVVIKYWVVPSVKYASVGDSIVVSVQEAIPRGRVKRVTWRKAVVVRTAKEFVVTMAQPSVSIATRRHSEQTRIGP